MFQDPIKKKKNNMQVLGAIGSPFSDDGQDMQDALSRFRSQSPVGRQSQNPLLQGINQAFAGGMQSGMGNAMTGFSMNDFNKSFDKGLNRKALLGDGVTNDDVLKKAQSNFQSQMGGTSTDPRFMGVNSATKPYVEGGYDMSKGIDNATPNSMLGKDATSKPEFPADMESRVNMGDAPEPSILGMAPMMGNILDLGDALINGPDQIKYDRLAFEGVDYNPIMQANNAQIRRGVNTGNENVRQNARTFGQSNQGMSAMNLRGAQLEGENTAKLGAMQRNTNAEIFNNERAANQQIDMVEQEAQRQTDMAHQQRITGNLMNIGTSAAGFGADKVRMAADHTLNSNFLNTMAYVSPIVRANMGNDQQLDLSTIFSKMMGF